MWKSAGHRKFEEDFLPMEVAASFCLCEDSSAQGNEAQKSVRAVFRPSGQTARGLRQRCAQLSALGKGSRRRALGQLHLTRAADTNKREASNEDSLFSASGSSPRAED